MGDGRYLHGLLQKQETVTESNRNLLVEAIRSISEILIWGDQNDPSVFESRLLPFLSPPALALKGARVAASSWRRTCSVSSSRS